MSPSMASYSAAALSGESSGTRRVFTWPGTGALAKSARIRRDIRGSYGGDLRASLASIAALAISFLLVACGPADESKPVTATEAEENIDQLLPALVDAIQAK